MAGDQLVEARDVLGAVRQLRRQGRARAMRQLERIEPDLIEHVLEELSRLHRGLSNTGANAKEVQRLYQQSEALVLVSLLALRAATLRLWHDQLSSPRLARLDPLLDPLSDANDPDPNPEDDADHDDERDGA